MGHPKAGNPESGAPVKFFAALLLSEEMAGSAAHADMDKLLKELEGILGPIDYRGKAFPFDMTDYYEDEMGPGISRVIVSFAPLGEAMDIVQVKHSARSLEDSFSKDGKRRINIDPGYIDFFKAVLASFKEGPQKIYIGEGVYADPVLMYQEGRWITLPWTFPDFKKGLYMDDLSAIRDIYKKKRRTSGSG
ncbi:MAG: DUF4416 family protein [Candidatus Krumholzibacteriota bacterium]|nr:DUF4416 family protein [Candidatus Krumholzibacteriota bacterium]